MSRIGFRGILRLAARSLLLVLLSVVLALAAAEVVYRLQPVDLYRGELRQYNARQDLVASDSLPTVLFMGDSVTAGTRSYPTIIRRERPDLRVINAAIPGSSVLQANLVAPARFSRFKPSVFVYQINVGNDLVNLRYPVNWSRLSPARNLYWTVVHRARSVEYLNYKMGQAARAREIDRLERELEDTGRALVDVSDTSCRYDFADFDPESYTLRIRLYLEAEPTLLDDQVLVSRARRREYERMLQGLRELLAYCEPDSCAAFLLVVPHASQVDAGYRDAMRRLGASIDPTPGSTADYPFVAGIRRHLRDSGMGHVQVLDALPVLRDVERQGRHAYFLHDPHLNGCGQAALARLVLTKVLRE